MVVCLPSLRYFFYVATDSASLLSLMLQVKAKEQVSVSLATKHHSARSNMYAGKRPNPMNFRRILEAVFQSELSRIFSDDFRPVPTGNYR
jgi:hypothetical protein